MSAATTRVSAFRWVPPFAQGQVRDLRVRWALEEAGIGYDARLIGGADQQTPAYRALQPFGQVPSLEHDGLALFESGACVLHIAERSGALMPADPADRVRVVTWAFAALNTVEPPIMMLFVIDQQPDAKSADGVKALRESVLGLLRARLDSLAAFLGDRDHLVGDRFTAADLLMTTVLRILADTDLLAGLPALAAYRLRGEARPAFRKALADQLAVFAAHEPKDA